MLRQTYLEVFIYLSQASGQISSAQLRKYAASGWLDSGLDGGPGQAKFKDQPLANQFNPTRVFGNPGTIQYSTF